MRIKRIIFVVSCCICLGLGCIGIVLAMLPIVPFFLATVFFFANSSGRHHDLFIATKLYKTHLESYVRKRGMLKKTKLTIVCTVTLMMAVGFYMMLRKAIYVPCVNKMLAGFSLNDCKK